MVLAAGALQIVEWDFTLNMLTPGQEVTGNVEGLRCAGHQHIGGACLELIDKATGEVIALVTILKSGGNPEPKDPFDCIFMPCICMPCYVSDTRRLY